MVDGSLAYASSVNNVSTPSHSPNTEGSTISFRIASNNATAGQARGTLQLQVPSLNAINPLSNVASILPDGMPVTLKGVASPIPDEHIGNHVPIAMLPLNKHFPPSKGPAFLKDADDLIDTAPTGNHVPAATPPVNTDIFASSTRISVAIVKSVQSLPTLPRSSDTTLQPSKTKEKLNLPTLNTGMVLTQGVSTRSPSPGIDAQLGVVSGTQTSTENYKSQYIFPSSHTLIFDPTTTRGFVSSTSAQNIPSSITQVLRDSSSTSSLLFHPTATPSIPNQPSPFTISGQTVTANSLSQYAIDNQTLTPGGAITVSGTKISLAPNASDLIVGTSTKASGPSATAKLSPGPKGTEVQQFTGYALGARDGLWSSSMMMLVSFVLLLWL